ncbi:histone-lysine N-methyltransferase SMYD3 isoform X2 [Latimeria chalumnae]|uniref:[histone H3]-lysine(4) N-trimethyltransferase n=2 Tax=Latimeria chalumnae TaxID=7897 RepID=H3B8B0_LATCH
MQEIGVGLYPSMSLLNHSCSPNCVIVFDGRRLLLHATQEIQANEELTVSYIDVLAPTQERQSQLKSQYCFTCDCQRCQAQDKDVDMLAGEEQVWKEVKSSAAKVEELQSRQEWEQVLALGQALVSSNQDILPDKNIHQLKMLDCIMDACIHLHRWEEALFYGTRTLEPYKLYYSGFHPVRAVQLMKVGKLQFHQELFPKALETLKQAFDIMNVTHGEDHPLTCDLKQLLRECTTAMETP